MASLTWAALQKLSMLLSYDTVRDPSLMALNGVHSITLASARFACDWQDVSGRVQVRKGKLRSLRCIVPGLGTREYGFAVRCP
jgi:hypothetical protein